jgi:hypothetical protein
MPSKAGMLAKVLKPATVRMTSATMSTAAGPPESVGKSATAEKPAICSRDAGNIRDRSSSRNSTRTVTKFGGHWTAAETIAGMPATVGTPTIVLASGATPTATEMPKIVRMPGQHLLSFRLISQKKSSEWRKIL